MLRVPGVISQPTCPLDLWREILRSVFQTHGVMVGHLSHAHSFILRNALKFEVVGVHHIAELLNQAWTVIACVNLVIRFVLVTKEVLVL